MKNYNYVIIGGGIIGLTIARELLHRFPGAAIAILEKEADVAMHSSGRNSGVLHAGFYYTADSLKAKFTREGNLAMKQYCRERGLPVNECGKLIIAKDESELQGLEELKRRGDRNGVELVWLDEVDAAKIDPNARTFRKALYSPATASVDPVAVCRALKEDVIRDGADFHFGTRFIKRRENRIITSSGIYVGDYIINAAGLYADKIAHEFGFGKDYQ
ncbi:MAG TPA: FAD-dependent oxidoreductase [Paenibacillus sp.]|uniref:NAD(P)/FAD-dependent oxidoreductase n=1 Tax=Paenibacillus sp. TaxID=58172 RepID=UPI002BE389E9|nr:FAD-dependent oxidoreductase [Paenibacillus sp.]HUC92000.1 FAD-dependent oxidoreductase [Paenibacillus sp.]